MILGGSFLEADFGCRLWNGVSIIFEGDAVFMWEEEACAVDVEARWGWSTSDLGQACPCGTVGGMAYVKMVALGENVMFPLTVSNSDGGEVAGSPRTDVER